MSILSAVVFGTLMSLVLTKVRTGTIDRGDLVTHAVLAVVALIVGSLVLVMAGTIPPPTN